MPIYEYHCAACGQRHDALQKVSDAPLTDCPACGAAALSKALKARGFAFVGPTTMYAAMQACGLVDDHVADCHVPPAR